MHLTRMRISGEPPFTERVEFNLDERVNLFVGPNASGKSTVLLMLAAHFIGGDAKRPIAQGMDSFGFLMISDDQWDDAGTWRQEWKNVLTASEDWSNPPVIHIGSVREVLPGISDVDALTYGETIDEVLTGSFSGSRTMYAYNLLAKEIWRDDADEELIKVRVPLMDAVELADACSKSICDEVIEDSRTHNYVPGPDIRGYLHHPHAPGNTIRVLRMLAVNTNDIRNFGNLSMWEEPSYSAYDESREKIPIYLGHLSSGTEGTLLWIRWLTLKILHHYEFAEDWNERPAILLIDEIENHLHPTWQRRVIPALLEHFPGLQIFATTHSPFVVAGLKAGQVHLLNRDENGLITTTTNTEDIVGWTADEILRTYMGVHDPTDVETASAAAELRKLRDEGPRGDDHAEQERQDRMRELRVAVDTNVLSGPRVAEDERFAATLESILERYRQSTDLNQENG